MAAFAYVLLPVSGLVAYFNGSDARIRWHGLQAIALGLLWPVALYGASAFSTRAAQMVWFIGAIVWLAFMVLAAVGRDVSLPFLGKLLRRAATASPKDAR